MRYWDSSALVPLLIEESASRACRDLLRRDPTVTTWILTRLEAWTACCRRRRAGILGAAGLETARRRLSRFADKWQEIADIPAVRSGAQHLVEVHDLRAADAAQLAAARVAFGAKVKDRAFVCLDERLAAAAAAEGFAVIRPAVA